MSWRDLREDAVVAGRGGSRASGEIRNAPVLYEAQGRPLSLIRRERPRQALRAGKPRCRGWHSASAVLAENATSPETQSISRESMSKAHSGSAISPRFVRVMDTVGRARAMSAHLWRVCALVLAAMAAWSAAALAQQVDPGQVSEGLKAIFRYGSGTRDTAERLNANTVTIMTGTIGGTYVRFGADL